MMRTDTVCRKGGFQTRGYMSPYRSLFSFLLHIVCVLYKDRNIEDDVDRRKHL